MILFIFKIDKMFLITVSSFYNDHSDIDFKINKVENIKDAIKDRLGESEMCGEFLHNFYLLGDPKTTSKIWVLIGIYHEYCDIVETLEGGDNHKNDITALIFANSLEEAKLLLKTHPVYIKDIADVIEHRNYTRKEIDDTDVVNYIFGDMGNQLAQLSGNFGEVPDEYLTLIKENIGNRDELKQREKLQQEEQKDEIEIIKANYEHQERIKFEEEYKRREIEDELRKKEEKERLKRMKEENKKIQHEYYLSQRELSIKDEERVQKQLQLQK
jgi:hypothetical protein